MRQTKPLYGKMYDHIKQMEVELYLCADFNGLGETHYYTTEDILERPVPFGEILYPKPGAIPRDVSGNPINK